MGGNQTMIDVTKPCMAAAKLPEAHADLGSNSTDSASESDSESPSKDTFLASLTKVEQTRFQKTFSSTEEAMQKMKEYAEFRKMYKLDSPEEQAAKQAGDDKADWEWASKTAVKAAKTVAKELIPGLEGCATPEKRVCSVDSLPQLCFEHRCADGSVAKTKDGHPIVHYLSALMDQNAASPEVWALAIVLFLSRKGSRDDDVGAFLLCDVRKGEGWTNHHAVTVFGAIKVLFHALHKVYPGRLEKMILYPVPFACVYLFKMMKAFLPAAIAKNITLHNGPDGEHDPPPNKKLAKYVSDEILEKMEKARRAQYLA